VARGFESKSVADQQDEAFGRHRPAAREDDPAAKAVDPALTAKRRKLELARAAVLQQLEAAHAEAHREMLRRALADLDQQLATLPS
jgi:hypothetical protein